MVLGALPSTPAVRATPGKFDNGENDSFTDPARVDCSPAPVGSDLTRFVPLR
jgi:hypothetical protein